MLYFVFAGKITCQPPIMVPSKTLMLIHYRGRVQHNPGFNASLSIPSIASLSYHTKHFFCSITGLIAFSLTPHHMPLALQSELPHYSHNIFTSLSPYNVNINSMLLSLSPSFTPLINRDDSILSDSDSSPTQLDLNLLDSDILGSLRS